MDMGNPVKLHKYIHVHYEFQKTKNKKQNVTLVESTEFIQITDMVRQYLCHIWLIRPHIIQLSLSCD